MGRSYGVNLNTFTLGKPRVANFAGTIKIGTSLKKQPLKTQKKLKEFESMY